MKDQKSNGEIAPTRRDMIKLGLLTGGVGLAALGGVSGAIARDRTLAPLETGVTIPASEDRPIVVGGGARWIEIELPFPFSVKSEEEGVYSIYKANGRPHLSNIVITDGNGRELFSWRIEGDWKLKFE